MKTTRPPRKTNDVSKHVEKAKTHASWPSSKKSESSAVREQSESPNK